MEALLENLEKICVDYNNQLSKYEALIYHTEQTNEKLTKYTESNRDKVDRLCLRVESKLNQVNERIEEIAEECNGLFELYSKEISTLNQEEREAFLKVLMVGLEQYKEQFLQDVLGDYQEILQSFMDQIHREADYIQHGQKDMEKLVKNTEDTNKELVTQVHGLRLVVNGCLEAINQTVGSINDKYLAIFSEFSKQVNAVNEEDREKFISGLSRTLEQYKEEYGIYEALVQTSQKLNKELAELTIRNTENINDLSKQVEQKLTRAEQLMKFIARSYEKGFEKFEKDVSVLNSRERESLCVAVRTLLEEYRFSFGKEIEGKAKEMNVMFQNTLLGVCSSFSLQNKEYSRLLESIKESNGQLQQQLEEKTDRIDVLTSGLLRREEKIEQSLDFLQDGYKEAIQKYMKEMQEANKKACELMEESMHQNTNKMVDRFMHQLELFKGERKTYAERTQQLLEEERGVREQLIQKQEEMIAQFKAEQIAWQLEQEEYQHKLFKWIAGLGMVTALLIAMCLLLLIPWGSSPVWTALVLVLVLALGIVVTIFHKKIIRFIKTIFL